MGLGHHHHGHGDCVGHGRNEGRLFWAAMVTGAFMVVEAGGGLISGSLALLADAGHMLADFGSLLLAWFGFRMARQPCDDRRTFGFHRFQVIAAFANGVTLALVALWIVGEAIHRLIAPVPVEAGTMMGIAILGLLVNIGAFALLHGADRDNLNVRGALLHVLGDLLGSVAAILAAVVILMTGWLAADPLLSLLVAGLIARGAWSILEHSGHILLEGVPAHVPAERLGAELVDAIPQVRDVHHVHVWCLNQDRVLATLHACIDAEDPAPTLVAIRDHLQDCYGIGQVTIEVERPGAATV